MARKLRTTAYAFIGVLVALLFVAWFLSSITGLALVKTEGTGTQTRYGIDNGYFYMNRSYIPGLATHTWRLEKSELYPRTFVWVSGYANRRIMLPVWLVIVLLAGAAYAPSRFSLSAMFIGTSLVAAILGLGVWLTR